MSKRSFAEVSFPISVSKSGNNSFTATAHNGCKSLFLSSVKKKNMKGCSLFNAKYYLCNRNSERSLVIQNNELSRISLISKSLPIQPVFNRRVLCFKHLAQYHIFGMEHCRNILDILTLSITLVCFLKTCKVLIFSEVEK